ncbi:Type I Iterative PKS [Gnomoniopsis sp. IMI 355080]|nr:Type I Iterative PKS [Gnomoniopsis sp. IMI 355080]
MPHDDVDGGMKVHTKDNRNFHSNGTNFHVTNGTGITDNGTNGYGPNGHIETNYSLNGAPGVSSNLPTTPSEKLDPAKATNHSCAEPIAICGMSLRLPGGLTTPQQLWEFLLEGGDARGRVPESRYNVAAYHSSTGKPGSVATEYGYFLDESVDLGALDTSFFSMPRTEVERADPQQRILLEVARECFEDAGVTPAGWRGRKVGCYVGSFGEDWVDMFAKETQPWGLYRVTGTGDFTLANRLSYEMDLQGPSSAEADGYARGEAIAAIYIKPISAAIRDGNPIRAVIRGTAHNVDGKTPGLSQPSAVAQEALIRRAYEVAGITDFGATAMVECHGTGTATGDPIEAKAVARVFGDEGVYIGSVKPNLGHAEGASGLVSIIKMVMALEHRTIPPNIRFVTPNPNIPFDSAKLTVPIRPMPWPESRLERVSVNSFGIGGANAHAILDSAASFNVRSRSIPRLDPTEPNVEGSKPLLLLYSANTAKSLTKMVDAYDLWIQKNPDKLSDLAYTLALRREHMPHRTFSLGSNTGSSVAKTAPPVKAASKPPKVVMVFTGQGAQWPQMGRDLLDSSDIFCASIKSLDAHLRAMATSADAPPAQYSIEAELRKPARKSGMSSAKLSQPLCTAVQIALVDTLRSINIVPDAVVGHSSGEIAAAYASGALSQSEAIIAAHHRGAVTALQTRSGAMAAVGMSWDDTEKYVSRVQGVSMACDNSPSSVTISGDKPGVEEVVSNIKKAHPDILARLLQVDKAYHSQHMVEIGEHYLSLIGPEVVGKDPATPFFSSVTGTLVQQGHGVTLGSQYWRQNLESPVRFRQAVKSILTHPEFSKNGAALVFLEVGPHSALAGPLRQICTDAGVPSPYVSAMTRNQDSVVSLLTAVGKLHCLNLPLDLTSVVPSGSCLADMPRYPWNHEGGTYWHESRLSKETRQRKHAYHNLLGVRVAESTDIEPVWRNVFHLRNVPWVRDHKVGEDVVLPFACYIALAGEAVQQVTGINEGFSLRNITVSLALVIADGKPTEIMTTFRPHRLTDTLMSQWWEFTVASFNGHQWNTHCVGQVMATPAAKLGESTYSSDRTFSDAATYPRKLTARRWYDTMRKGGLDLGPAFQTLQTIGTSTDEGTPVATAEVLESTHGDEDDYHVHPTVIDATLQLLGAAATNGRTRKVRNWLPTSIDELSISRCCPSSAAMVTTVTAEETSNSSLVGHGRCILAEGLHVLDASGIRMSPGNGAPSAELPDTHAAARHVWDTAIDFIPDEDLLPVSHGHIETYQWDLLKELTEACCHRSCEYFPDGHGGTEVLDRYAKWIISQIDQVAGELTRSTLMCKEYTSDEEFLDKIQGLVDGLAETPLATAATAVQIVCTNMERLAAGETLESLLPDGIIPKLYRLIDQSDLSKFLCHMVHYNPNLRVLVVGGADRGVLLPDLLRHLSLADGQVLCSKLTVTTTGFISGKDHQKLFPGLEYATLDISKDIVEQGFEDRQYDLVLATNVVHTTKCLRQSLENIKKLMFPNGRLLLQELCPNPSSKWINYVFGTQPGWWCGTGDGRDYEPHAGVERWRSELLAAGFDGLSGLLQQTDSTSVSKSAVVDSHLLSSIIARPRATRTCAEQQQQPKRVTILHHSDPQNHSDARKFQESLRRALEGRGYQVAYCTLGDEPPPAGQDVISLLDTQGPFLEAMDAAGFAKLKAFLQHLDSSGVLWVTSLCQTGGCRDPGYAQVIGFARTMRSEMLIDFATCEVDTLSDMSSSTVSRVFSKFAERKDATAQREDDPLKPDFEFVVEEGVVKVGRFYPFALRDRLLEEKPEYRATLDVGTPGRINTLQWSRCPPEEVQAGDVEVEVHAAGLNFRDILVALGIVELPVRQFGLEAAGIVTAVGSDVRDIQVGERVLCLKKHAFATRISVPRFACAKLPATGMTFVEAASVLVPYVTAIHSLINIGGLEEGQSVLIHSACGGVGLAAVQIALARGAQVYVTVGSEDKVRYLMETFPEIPRNRILQSRDSSFVEGIRRETKGRGVDVVLNSLSGELLHATWRCVAEFGIMVEIGKRDLLGRGKLDMQTFLANRSYSCVDIDQLWKKPAVLSSLIEATMEYYRLGHIKARPATVFDAVKTPDAFRYMQKGQHIGRVVLRLHDDSGRETINSEGLTAKARRVTHFNSAPSSYLLVGGLGGLGQALSVWMAENHACELVFLTRSAGEDVKHSKFVAELESMGCRVTLVKGDVTVREDVDRAVAAASLPLKGVIQMSMVLRDQNFESMTFEEWTAASAPKVQGTWNLHRSTARCNLDFFVLFSSLSGIVGQPGQANYASANTFLDSFAQYRTSLGLPASVVQIGAVEDVGFVSQSPGLMNKMKHTGFKGITEQEFLDAMEVAISSKAGAVSPASQSPPCETQNTSTDGNTFVLGLGSTTPLTSSANRAVWRKDRRMAAYHNASAGNNSGAGASSSNEELKTFLASARGDPALLHTVDTAMFLAVEIGKKLFDLLLKPHEDLNTSWSLVDLGLDSLVAIELRTWWKQVFSFDISVLEMLGMGSLDALGKHAAEGLLAIATEVKE